MSAVTNVSTRKEVTVVHAPETYISIATTRAANIKIFVNTIMADVVRYASFITIIRDVHVEKDLKWIERIKLCVLISMSVALSISKIKDFQKKENDNRKALANIFKFSKDVTKK